jgi:hypothetical protein
VPRRALNDDPSFTGLTMSHVNRQVFLPVCLVIAFLALGGAWVGGNPPAASPDENGHFIRAYATADGQIRGESSPVVSLPTDATRVDERRANWFSVTNRSFRIPARLVPGDTVACYAFDRERTADCQDFTSPAEGNDVIVLVTTHLGTYSPFAYLIPGMAMQGSNDFLSAARRGRLGSLALCGLFIAWAATLLRHRGVFSLVGLTCAMTPMVIFLAASMNTSGIEITAAILFWSVSITLTREPGSQQRSAWAAFAVAGTALALTRPLGAILTTIVIATIAGFAEFTHIRKAVRGAPWSAWAALALVSTACAISFLWAQLAIPHPHVNLALAADSLGEATRDLPNQVREIIGIFGWNETTMPLPGYLLGLSLICGLGGLALVLGSVRERLTLMGLGICIVVLDMMLAVFVEAQIGFGMQARYVMPLVVGLSLMAGDIVQRHADRLSFSTQHRAAAIALASWALLQVIAFFANEHRYAVGTSGAWLPPWDTRWSPEGGLAIWMALAILGSGTMAAAAVVLYRAPRAVSLSSHADQHDSLARTSEKDLSGGLVSR